jgi:thymidine phosphorylase
MDAGAGVELLRKLGDPVQQGEALYAIHAEFPADFRFARAQAGQSSGYAIGEPVAGQDRRLLEENVVRK